MRNQYCGCVDETRIGSTVALCGWVDHRRDHGHLVFIDLRDSRGSVQVVFTPEEEEAFRNVSKVRQEYVLYVEGKVRRRLAGSERKESATGAVEVLVHSAEVLGKADPLPFQLNDENISDAIKARYRFLDLRRPAMQRNIRMRARIVRELRQYLEERDFVEIETPVLTRSTPEGARDYLVPSRTYPGRFFALPQSPQLFKQMLMVSGFEKYYQLARCFRDEDLRADRQPEFTQLDVEMCFLDENGVMDLMEGLIRRLFKTVLNVDLPSPFPRMPYDEAMGRFGSDKPDLRYPLEFVDLTDDLAGTGFEVFAAARRDGGCVKAMRVPGGEAFTRKRIAELETLVRNQGAKGLPFIRVDEPELGRKGLRSAVLKHLSDEEIRTICARCEARAGDLIFFGADAPTVVNRALGALRLELGPALTANADWCPLWVVDFPMFEWDEDARRYVALHHPFTAPKPEDLDKISSDPANARARAYDLVLNGVEVGGGSIRIHGRELQEQVFEALGISPEKAAEAFGFLLDALRFGAPPHGGIAMGVDRLCALMCGVESIRDVIAFPKTQSAACALTNAPGGVSEDQLRDLSGNRQSLAASAKQASEGMSPADAVAC